MLLTICLIVIAVSVVTALSVLFIRNNERRETDQLLLLLCETGERNLDYYFSSVQHSVQKVSDYTEKDLKTVEALDDGQLRLHMERVGHYFEEMANKTNGVLTYYYRLDPEVSASVKGFWYTNLDGADFVSHEVTDITLYDTQDTSKLVWFTVPKHTGQAIWLSPYVTDNLEVRVISYNVPIYWKRQFVGVVGIEIDYSTMAKQVESIRLHTNGYAFLNDAQGNVFFHPRIDVATLPEDSLPVPPEGLIDDSTFFRYRYEGVEKQAAWLPLSNGMRLTVSVPVNEAEGEWQSLIRNIVAASSLVLLSLSLFTLYYTRRITRPLEQLSEAAEQAEHGNYDFTLAYDRDDEIGRLTGAFRKLARHLKNHISDLNSRAYIDALTSVNNQGAFSAALQDLQTRVDHRELCPAFAVGVFDCDDLKSINDRYGHDKGNIYLKTASGLICRVFAHSPVYRIGGDEFAVILQDEDFERREELIAAFNREAEQISAMTENSWEQVRLALGVAVYDAQRDRYVIDTVRRADKNMYANKRHRKKAAAVR